MFSSVWVDFRLPPIAFFVVQTELAISNFVTKLFIVHRSTMKQNVSLKNTWHRKKLITGR